MPSEITGTIFDIQRFSIDDGPGIRTTVFLKGCPLRCIWCHNPESWIEKPELGFLLIRCISCGECLRVCPQVAHRLENGKHLIDRSVCIVCGACTKHCYAGVLEIVGKKMSVEQVIDEVRKDIEFYEHSGGGMTLSGGEPASQIDFSVALLEAAKLAGIHTAVETSGYCKTEVIERLAKYTDIFLYDIKADPKRHKELTGVLIEPILRNFAYLVSMKASIQVRLPLIPGINDTEEHIGHVISLMKKNNRDISVDILPYNSLGTSKHARFEIPNPLANKKITNAESIAKEWSQRFIKAGIQAGII